MVEKYELDQNQMEGTKMWKRRIVAKGTKTGKSMISTNRRKILNGGKVRIGLTGRD